ncbi:hypothetical protein EJ08DRAFT_662119 [Tothia fuscella]|uniref:Uncharacterized protein n=1 Tax=Tothia fuscella TaxID=1048955 RepID=A0A9P4TXK6_9PEZI|nr:hypothetical protein EJ08DRAFT_662119 [Tothia fuscella]
MSTSVDDFNTNIGYTASPDFSREAKDGGSTRATFSKFTKPFTTCRQFYIEESPIFYKAILPRMVIPFSAKTGIEGPSAVRTTHQDLFSKVRFCPSLRLHRRLYQAIGIHLGITEHVYLRLLKIRTDYTATIVTDPLQEKFVLDKKNGKLPWDSLGFHVFEGEGWSVTMYLPDYDSYMRELYGEDEPALDPEFCLPIYLEGNISKFGLLWEDVVTGDDDI